MEHFYAEMYRVVYEGEVDAAGPAAERALAAGLDPLECVNRGFMRALEQVGREFGAGDKFLPELVAAGEAVQRALAVLQPRLQESGIRRESLGLVLLGTVEGDIHEIGKRIVGALLAAAGFEVVDLGVDVPAARFLERARELRPAIVGMSALLTTTMVRQREVIAALRRENVPARVMVGGAPVTPSWAEEIGADGYAEDASAAVDLARQLVGGGKQ
ncbi:MAG: corrinoid protein [bacterium]|nr:corrinoid protein [bacterium]